MADNFLQEYKEYYSVRAEKYADNPNYPNSYKAEKALSDAMQSCAVLEEFRDKIGNLNELCAVALVKDEYLMEKAHFTKHQETVRINASQQVLQKTETITEVMELMPAVTEIENANSIKISMDEAHREFQSDWDLVDEITIYENAVVPDNYKQKMMQSAQKTKDSIISGVNSLEKNNTEWQAGWRLNPEINMEYRHRNLLPYSDEHITEQLAKYKSIINR